MTAPALNLVCHTEPLPDYGDGKRYFSVNVAVAIDAGASVTEAEVKTYLDPRRWSVKDAFLTRIDDAGQVKQTVRATLVAGKIAEPAADEAAGAMLAHLLKNGVDLFKLDRGKVKDAETANVPRWHAALLQLGTGAARVSHALEITVVCSIAAGDLASIREVIGAPKVEWVDEQGAVILTATPKMIPNAHDLTTAPFIRRAAGEYEWEYDGVAVIAMANSGPPLRSGKNGFVDLATGWVLPDAGFRVRASDVNVALESRGADLFDATTQLLDSLPEVMTDAEFPAAMSALPWLIADGLAGKELFDTIREKLKGGTLSDAELGDISAAIGKGVDPSKPEVDVAWRATVEQVLGVILQRGSFSVAVVRDALRDAARMRLLVVEMWIAAARAHVASAVAEKFAKLKDAVVTLLAPAIVEPRYRAIARAERQKIIARASATASATPDEERTKIVDAIAERVMARWSDLAANPRITAAVSAFRTTLAARARSAAAGVIRGNPNRPQLDALEEDGLAIQLSPVAADAGSAGDLTRQIGGFGVLLRAGADKRWSCLNMARLSKDATPAVVAARMQYRNGVRQSYVVYENEPLVAASPLGEPNKFNLGAKPDASSAATAILAYGNAYKKGSDWTLPPLIYGRTYEVAAFAIGNGGALPKELAAKPGGNLVPWELATLTSDALANSWSVLYKRRRPVGPCRLVKAKDGASIETFENLGLPPIPPAVHPIARNLESSRRFESDGTTPAPPTPAASLLLLHHESTTRRSFAFDMRLPALDLPVWDRWVGKKKDDAARNAKVWAAYLEKANAGDPNEPHDAPADLTVDDPAVSEIFVHLLRRWSADGVAAEKWEKVGIPFTAAGSEGLDLVRHKPFRVTVKTGAGLGFDVDKDKRLITITIPEKEVWRIGIHPAVTTANADLFEAVDWFDTSASTNPPAGFKLAQPLELDVEVIPARQEISADHLHAALQLSSANGKLLVKLDRAKLSSTAPWIHDVEVLLQQWRWDGRPLMVPEGASLHDGFFKRVPAGADPGPFNPKIAEAEGILLDATLFADRDSADRLEIPSFIEAIDKTRNEWTLDERELSLVQGALYFRAAVRAHSRYQPLVDVAVESRLAKVTDAGGNVVATDAWQRTVVPARWRRDVPPPAVKLVLPLTRPASSAARNAGVLVVIDEPWFDIGGLGERFEAEVMSAVVPGTGAVLPEIGPDPILSLEPLKLKNDATIAQATGPIGFTFDVAGTSAPLFARSSFIVEPASVVEDQTQDLAWTMVKLRFRRVLERESYGDARDRMADRVSEPTVPFWTQLLPSATAFQCRSEDAKTALVPVSELTAVRTAQGLEFRRDGRTILPLPQQPDALSRSRFTLYALVTRKWIDAGGQLSESYVSVEDLDGAGVPLTEAVPAGEYALRLIEVQWRASSASDKPVKAANLWKTLFPDAAIPGGALVNDYDNTANAIARIVRMSDAIEVL